MVDWLNLPTGPAPKRNAISAGLSSGLDSLQGLGYSAGAAVADAVGADRPKEWLLEQAERNQFEAQQNGRPDLERVEDVADTPSKWLPFLGYQIAKQVPQIAGSFALAATPMAAAAAPAWLARGAASLPKMVGGGGGLAVGGGMANRAALRAGQTFARNLTGGMGMGTGMGAGSMYQESVDAGDPSPYAALGMAPLYGITEGIPQAVLGGTLMRGGGFSGNLLSRVGKAAGTNAVSGATSELVQNEMEMGFNPNLSDEEIFSRRLNSAVVGGLAEGAIGSVGGIHRRPEPQNLLAPQTQPQVPQADLDAFAANYGDPYAPVGGMATAPRTAQTDPNFTGFGNEDPNPYSEDLDPFRERPPVRPTAEQPRYVLVEGADGKLHKVPHPTQKGRYVQDDPSPAFPYATLGDPDAAVVAQDNLGMGGVDQQGADALYGESGQEFEQIALAEARRRQEEAVAKDKAAKAKTKADFDAQVAAADKAREENKAAAYEEIFKADERDQDGQYPAVLQPKVIENLAQLRTMREEIGDAAYFKQLADIRESVQTGQPAAMLKAAKTAVKDAQKIIDEKEKARVAKATETQQTKAEGPKAPATPVKPNVTPSTPAGKPATSSGPASAVTQPGVGTVRSDAPIGDGGVKPAKGVGPGNGAPAPVAAATTAAPAAVVKKARIVPKGTMPAATPALPTNTAEASTISEAPVDPIKAAADAVREKRRKRAANADAMAKGEAIPHPEIDTKMNSGGVNSEDLQDMFVLAVEYIRDGARTFAAYSKAMIDEFGDKVVPHLRKLHTEANEELKTKKVDLSVDKHSPDKAPLVSFSSNAKGEDVGLTARMAKGPHAVATYSNGSWVLDPEKSGRTGASPQVLGATREEALQELPYAVARADKEIKDADKATTKKNPSGKVAVKFKPTETAIVGGRLDTEAMARAMSGNPALHRAVRYYLGIDDDGTRMIDDEQMSQQAAAELAGVGKNSAAAVNDAIKKMGISNYHIKRFMQGSETVNPIEGYVGEAAQEDTAVSYIDAMLDVDAEDNQDGVYDEQRDTGDGVATSDQGKDELENERVSNDRATIGMGTMSSVGGTAGATDGDKNSSIARARFYSNIKKKGVANVDLHELLTAYTLGARYVTEATGTASAIVKRNADENKALLYALSREIEKRYAADRAGAIQAQHTLQRVLIKRGLMQPNTEGEGNESVTKTARPDRDGGEDGGVDEAGFDGDGTRESDEGVDEDTGYSADGTALYATTNTAPVNGGISAQVAQDAVDKVLDSLGLGSVVQIEVARNPAAVGIKTAQGVMPSGGTRNGKVYLFTDNIADAAEAFKVIFHELFHLGLSQSVQQGQYIQSMLKFLADPTVRQYAAAWKRGDDGKSRVGAMPVNNWNALAVEEAMAIISEELNTKADGLGAKKMPQFVRSMARILADVAQDWGLPKVARALRSMTYTDAEKFVRDTLVKGRSGAPVHLRDTRFAAATLSTQRQSVADQIRANMSPKAKDSWATVTDYLKSKMPWLLTNPQLVEQFGKLFKNGSLKHYSDIQHLMSSETNTQTQVFHEIAVHWDKLRSDNPAMDKMLNKLMLQATLAEIHPDVELTHKDNKHLLPTKKAEYEKLAAQYKALSPEAKRIYQDAKKALKDAWQLRRDAYEKLVGYTFAQRMAESGGDTAKMDQISRDEQDALKAYDVKEIKGPYFPLVRFGSYLAIAESPQLKALREQVDNATGAERRKLDEQLQKLKKDRMHYRVSAHETLGQRNAAIRQMKLDGFDDPRTDMTDQHIDGMRAVSQDTMSHITEMINAQFDPDVAADLNRSMTNIFLRSLPEMHALHREAARQGIEGASADMLRAFASTGQQGAFYTARLMYASELADAMQSMKAEAKGNVDMQHIHREMEKRMALDMRRTDTPVQSALGTLSWISHLGLSPSFMVINATQPWLVTGPVLSGKFGINRATKALASASHDAMKILHAARMKDGKWDAWSGISEDSLASKEERTMIRELMKRGIVDEGAQNDLTQFANDKHKWLDKASRISGWATQQIELVNRTATALASFRLARGNGMDYDAAMNYAYDTTVATQFDYSAEGTARIMREGGGIPFARLVFQFRRYQQGMLYLLVNNLKKLALSPGERKQAAATLGYFVMSSGMAAGALGLPFIGSAIALANLFIDDDDPEGDAETRLRNYIYHMTGGDKYTSDILAKGIPAAFGADLSKRIGLSDVASPFPMMRFEGARTGRAKAGEAALNVIGPTGGMAASAFDAYDFFMQGDWYKGVEKLAPKFAMDPMRAARYATEGMTDGSETPTGTEISNWAVFIKGLGIAPTAEANYYEGTAAIKDVTKAITDRKSNIGMKFRTALRKGDMADVREMINEFNKDHPENPITSKTETEWRKAARTATDNRGPTSGVKLGTKTTEPYNKLAAFAQ